MRRATPKASSRFQPRPPMEGPLGSSSPRLRCLPPYQAKTDVSRARNPQTVNLTNLLGFIMSSCGHSALSQDRPEILSNKLADVHKTGLRREGVMFHRFANLFFNGERAFKSSTRPAPSSLLLTPSLPLLRSQTSSSTSTVTSATSWQQLSRHGLASLTRLLPLSPCTTPK